MDHKSKLTLRKIVEEFIDDEELSDDMKKERLLDICNKLEPSSKQPSAHDDQKYKVPIQSTISSPIALLMRLLMSHNNKSKLMAKVT